MCWTHLFVYTLERMKSSQLNYFECISNQVDRVDSSVTIESTRPTYVKKYTERIFFKLTTQKMWVNWSESSQIESTELELHLTR